MCETTARAKFKRRLGPFVSPGSERPEISFGRGVSPRDPGRPYYSTAVPRRSLKSGPGRPLNCFWGGGGGISNCKSEGARGQPTGGLCRGGTFPLQPSRAGKFGSGLDPPRGRCGRQDHGAPAHRPAPLGPQTALPFLLICFPPAPGRGGGAPGPRRLPGTRVGSAKERRACGSSSRHLRFRVAGLEARPSPPTAGPGRPQAPPTWRAARSAGPDGRHTMETTAGPAGPRRREPLARWGRRKVPEPACAVGGGVGNAGPRARQAAAGTSHPSQQLHSVAPPPPETSGPRFGRPGHRRRDRSPTTLTRGRHFLSFLLVLSTSVSLSLSL